MYQIGISSTKYDLGVDHELSSGYSPKKELLLQALV